MKILQIHNHYRYRGGEDAVVASERRVLENRGHVVIVYDRDNVDIGGYGPVRKAALFVSSSWAPLTVREVEALIRDHRPDVAHVHNTQPLVSPSVYWALDRAGIPVVQTLHNFRLFCPAGTFFRNNLVCEECREHSLLRSVKYGCYRGSRLQTLAVAQSLAVHRALGAWTRKIDLYVALTEFGRKKFIACGIPEGQITVKSNFLESPPPPRYDHEGYAIFVGRLSPEKGLLTLLKAWRELPWLPLRVIGDGPLRPGLEARVQREGIKGFEMLGPLPLEACLAQLRGARFAIFPAEWYEGLPRVIIEAYACGKPVIASRLGAMAELVVDGVTGVHFTPGDAADLTKKVLWMVENEAAASEMGRAARREFELKYTEERNYELLMGVYRRAIERRREIRAAG